MKSNLQKEKRKKYVRLKKNFGWRILCAVGIIFSAVSLLTGCRMEQWEADISEKTEKSIRVSKPMQASLDVVAAGETLSLLPGQESFCTVTLPEALPRIDRPSLSVQVTLDEKTVFSGTAAQLESFVPHQNGQYRYSFSDGDSYTLIAEIAFAPQIFWQESDVLLGGGVTLDSAVYRCANSGC